MPAGNLESPSGRGNTSPNTPPGRLTCQRWSRNKKRRLVELRHNGDALQNLKAGLFQIFHPNLRREEVDQMVKDLIVSLQGPSPCSPA